MTTSGTVVFRTTRDNLIKSSLRLLNAYDPENSIGPTTAQLTNGAEALNMMVKGFEAKGLQLWERKYAAVFPQKGQGVYTLGSPGPAGDHATLATPIGIANFVQTTLASDASSGATSVIVTSASSNSSVGHAAVSITDTYNIGIKLDTGYLQWTTVSGSPVGTTVTLAAALTSAASLGNTIYCYQTKLVKPLRILDGFVRQSAGNDVPAMVISREQYNRFGLKSSTGTPVQLYYDPQENSGDLYVYPTFLTVDQVLYIEFQKPIEDFNASGDDFDLPQEWGECLKFNLAFRLAPEYEISTEKFNQIKYLAESSMAALDAWDQEYASLLVQPNLTIAYPTDKSGY